jgi:hypothetical protein
MRIITPAPDVTPAELAQSLTASGRSWPCARAVAICPHWTYGGTHSAGDDAIVKTYQRVGEEQVVEAGGTEEDAAACTGRWSRA